MYVFLQMYTREGGGALESMFYFATAKSTVAVEKFVRAFCVFIIYLVV